MPFALARRLQGSYLVLRQKGDKVRGPAGEFVTGPDLEEPRSAHSLHERRLSREAEEAKSLSSFSISRCVDSAGAGRVGAQGGADCHPGLFKSAAAARRRFTLISVN